MVKGKVRPYLFSMCSAALALAAGVLLLPGAAPAQTISKTAKVGVYSVTLSVIRPPAGFFSGPNTMTVWKGVAVPNRELGLMHCIMVAAIKKHGKPLGNARVKISYRKLSSQVGPWTDLPVTPWWFGTKAQAAYGYTPQTTRFGNHVVLLPGRYEARVTVNGSGPGTFHFVLHSRSSRKKAGSHGQ